MHSAGQNNYQNVIKSSTLLNKSHCPDVVEKLIKILPIILTNMKLLEINYIFIAHLMVLKLKDGINFQLAYHHFIYTFVYTLIDLKIQYNCVDLSTIHMSHCNNRGHK